MRKLYAVVWWTLALQAWSLSPAQDLARLDRDRGFIGVKLGGPVRQLGASEAVRKTAIDSWYVQKNQRLEWGALKLKGVRYRVFDGKIVSIQLQPASAGDSELLLATLVKGFGPTPIKEFGQGMKTARWTGEAVRLTYLHNPRQDNFTVEFVDTGLDAAATDKALRLAEGSH